MNGFSLIETMRFEPAEGLVRASLHRARLFNSARKLGFAGAADAWDLLLAQTAPCTEPARARLELLKDGRAEVGLAPFAPQPPDTVWKLAISTTVRLDSTGPLLRHKTSLRDAYDRARAEFARDVADEVLLLNERDEIAEGTITNIFLEAGDGVLITPPLSSGCLAGVLRTSLICGKRARVERIFPSDLAERPFYVGNSLRGLIRAELAK